ncbi:MAG TPA: hypothetical protein PKK09_05790 [Anaerolineaceae bacterium]|jgi:hypothetical protein|nr:hypothetical protein [Anaerolineaceae bacterium]HNW13156.1 hypothetical protein [Anaerolineaceae bacterium]HOE02895.1 hypothetical protein [Anaerolineaceae bacterium]
MNKKIGVTLLVLIISSCVLLSAGVIIGAYLLLKAQKNYTDPLLTLRNTPAVATVTAAQQTQAAAPSDGLPPKIAKQMDEIQQQVIAIRGLHMTTDLKRDLLTPEELQDKVINDFFADYSDEDALKDSKVLSTLGLLDEGFDLKQFYLDLYSEQIAGYYDSETKDMYVIAGEGFGGMERMTYAHEFNHVLQDQNYDLENGMKLNDDYCKVDTEYCAAVSALIEGDSVSTENEWFLKHSTRQDQKDLFSFQEEYTSPVYDSAPAYMKEDFLFPYTFGLDFVQQLINQGGWAAVDAAYANPPVSTEQILHPEKYPDDRPVPVEMPDLAGMLGDDWSELDRNVMGEWYTYLVFAKGRSSQFSMDDEKSKTAAAGWGGDTYVYYATADLKEHLFAWRSTWDTSSDAGEYFDMSRDYGLARWGIPVQNSNGVISWNSTSDGIITMRRSGPDVLWVIGSSKEVVEDALTEIKDFGK